MRKRLLCIAAVISVLFSGCQRTTDDFLSYQSLVSDQGFTTDNRITEADFFAENLTIVTQEDNIGGDDQLSSSSSLLVDITDQSVTYADHVYDRLYPASLTKLITALVVLKHGELTDMVTISYDASHITESGAKTSGFKEGDVISMDALLRCMLVYSGNDAAIAVAEHVGGSVDDFVKLMNEEAKKIGAVHSNFVNPSGLHDDNQYTTAYDLYLIFNELLKYDTIREIIQLSSYTAEYTDSNGNTKQNTYESTNLFWKDGTALTEGLNMIGGKTGTTSKAGNCLILLVKNSQDKEFIAVILKATSKDNLYSQMSYLLSKAEEE